MDFNRFLVVLIWVLLHSVASFAAESPDDKSFVVVGKPPLGGTVEPILKSCNGPHERFTPCACREVLSRKKRVRNGKVVTMKYTETLCDVEENTRRSDAGIIDPEYKCMQLKSHMILYRDAHDNPIYEMVPYVSGCELRLGAPLGSRKFRLGAQRKHKAKIIADGK